MTRKTPAPKAPAAAEPVIQAQEATEPTQEQGTQPELDVVVTESGNVQPVAIINVTHLHVALMTPEIEEGDTEMPTQYDEGSIQWFKAEDRRTMRLVMTSNGLRAVAVESEA